MTKEEASVLIKQKAYELGFSACGIVKAEAVDTLAVAEQEEWLAKGFAAGMDYMQKNKNLRYDPRELVPGAKSMIIVAMNYYPKKESSSDVSFAYYSYGKDYHFVLKNYLSYLFKYIKEEISPLLCPNLEVEGRYFTDSAPMMERYWAKKAGVGFQGRNRLIIVPRVGSFCFLGTLAVNIDLSVDEPLNISCGKCHKCEESCPTHAICGGFVDSNKCISYQTIENRTDIIPDSVASYMGNHIYGCDICQKVCPWNKFAKATTIPEFSPSDNFMNIDSSIIENMGSSEFKRLFKESAVVRAGLKNLKRNLGYVKKTFDSSRIDE